MSKFLPQKKKLLEEVYEKAKNEAIETSFNGIAKHLERSLKDDYSVNLTYKSFETYYQTIVEKEKDYNIKRAILDDLCKYIEYDNFVNYCMEWKTIEYAINHTVSKIVINIVNKPVISWSSAVKNGFGFVEFTFIFLLLTGSVAFSNSRKESLDAKDIWMGLLGGQLDIDKKYMYWNGERYIATDSANLGRQFKVIAMQKDDFKDLKKITQPDTLTIENAMGKVWYDKSDNKVEFFTSFGKHPKNEKALKDVSERILENYAGENAEP
ncbi:hypothetical protein [Chryseobacterium jejuense]|uniref:Uncharacterized protein n=1 Tax=Chryseobacterium jejuense TaxID=445960 RepID=A0A2X2XJN5_CHRJE|nr:hypothetical protein [Chryseobacterium jejuense]SDI71044.1 hypothetical protein SAMN05421542_1818 [Chryseobacterium jejuense]SQB26560.1 Uncharacterised protein [Chryseobacterium jejuense]